MLCEHIQGKRFAWDTDVSSDIPENVPTARESRFKAAVPVMYGCNNFCTYCIVPYVRGRERSRQPEAILDEVRGLIESGYKEIMLLGQNVNSYGKDLPDGMDFPALLREIDKLPGEYWIRFMSSHPKDASPTLMDAILECDHLAKHLHLPVQSGSNAILQRMNRRYTVESYLEKVRYIRGKSPDFSLTTDLIVGFPDESEADFQGTLDLVREVRFDNMYSFIYSKRTGTKAALMPDGITDAEKSESMGRLLALQRDIAVENNKRFVGRTLTVLVDGESKKRPGMLTGRSSENMLVEFPGTPDRIGQFVKVTITASHSGMVSGERTD
jgi:tRNA-2-methylthio-N6-dimethylallyladenosine synthase